jgi:hypothetical protein
VQLGYDVTWHRISGATYLTIDGVEDKKFQHRLNLGYDIAFSDDALLKLLITGDLDEFGTARSWEGGNAQFRLVF